MRAVRRIVPILFVLIVAQRCATVGAGDPVVVKTQDFLVNSLNTYDAAMTWHKAHSTTESVATYRTLEQGRVKFPVAWQAVKDGLATYKVSHDKNQLETLIATAQTILNGITPLIGGR